MKKASDPIPTSTYDKRIARGMARGLSKSQARGHARTRKGELPASVIKIRMQGTIGEKFDYIAQQVLLQRSVTAARKEVGLSARQFKQNRQELSPSLFKVGPRYKAKQFEIAYFTPGLEEPQNAVVTGASARWLRRYNDTIAVLRKNDRRSAAYKKAADDFEKMRKDLKAGKVKIRDVEGRRIYPSTNFAHIDYLMEQLTEKEYQDFQEAYYRQAEAA